MNRIPTLALTPLAAAVVVATAWLLAGCDNGQSRQNRGADYTELKRQDDTFQAGVNRAPTAHTLYAMSRILAAQHRDQECELVLAKILKDYPAYLPAYNEMAELQMRQRKIDEAVATLQAGLKLAPQSPVFINNLGMCQLIKGDYPAALIYFTRSAARAPDDARYRANVAVALGMMGRYDESLALYQQITTPADAHYNLAVLADARHDQARAVSEYAQAQTAAAEQARKEGKDSAKKPPQAMD